MRLIILCLFVCLNCVLSKTVTKSLTESMGQEVIEIGSPLKELPDDLEEEPSAEKDEDDVTTATIQPATKKEVKKATLDGRKKMKDVDKIDAISRNQEEDEERVEKELADIYKDSNDYKGDSDEATSAKTETPGEKLALRQIPLRDNFKFQPDSNKPKDIERFRTSIDEISCDRSVTRKLDQNPEKPGAAASNFASLLLLGLCVFSAFCY